MRNRRVHDTGSQYQAERSDIYTEKEGPGVSTTKQVRRLIPSPATVGRFTERLSGTAANQCIRVKRTQAHLISE